MQIVVAKEGLFIETVRLHAHGSATVLPYGADWSGLIGSDCAFEVLLKHPIARQPTHSPESS